jgi:hypothetical protein
MTAIQTRLHKGYCGIGVTMITFLIGARLAVSACALGNQRYGTPWTITTTNDCWVGIGVMFVSLVGLMLFTSSLLGTLREAGFLRPSPRPHSDSAMRQEGRKDDDQVTHDREGCGRCGGRHRAEARLCVCDARWAGAVLHPLRRAPSPNRP